MDWHIPDVYRLRYADGRKADSAAWIVLSGLLTWTLFKFVAAVEKFQKINAAFL